MRDLNVQTEYSLKEEAFLLTGCSGAQNGGQRVTYKWAGGVGSKVIFLALFLTLEV